MSLIIVSQDKKSIWDFSQCYLFIPNDGINNIAIRPYSAENSLIIGTYKDPVKAEEVFKEIINVFGKSKLVLKPNMYLAHEDLEYAKRYYEDLNKERFIINGPEFEILPLGNNNTMIYQLPEDEENDDSKE